ncbi:MAG: hypothetical protein LIV24_09120 [Eubacterium sp.]|nr:hypothetical protein [Eubacterium sp.]
MTADRLESYVDDFEKMWRKAYPPTENGRNINTFLWDYLNEDWKKHLDEELEEEEPEDDMGEASSFLKKGGKVRVLINAAQASPEEIGFVVHLLLGMGEKFCVGTTDGHGNELEDCSGCPKSQCRVKILV